MRTAIPSLVGFAKAPWNKGRLTGQKRPLKGSGAPIGNQNAVKHGVYTRESIAQRRAIRELLRGAREVPKRFEER